MIKPVFEHVNVLTNNSFSLQVFEPGALEFPFHYHPEFELTIITSGSGKRFIGDCIENFNYGDLVFLGPNLPHCWKLDSYLEDDRNVSSIVVHFTSNFLRDDFFCKPELNEIHKLVERSRKGIVYNRSIIPEISEDLKTLAKEDNSFKKLHLLLNVLHKLSVTRDYTLLNGLSYVENLNRGDLERINKIFDYITDNYKTNVCLQDAAELACMTPNSFCKYFKKVTQKTFIEVVVEYRLRYALSQLLHTSKSVAQICFDSGFNDIVYFNRMFKSKLNVSPLQYKKNFQKTLSVFDDLNHSKELFTRRRLKI